MTRSAERSVLILERDLSVRRIAQEALERAGYLASTAGDIKTAISLIEKRGFDLIVCDGTLPPIDCRSFLEACERARINSKVILLNHVGGDSARHGLSSTQNLLCLTGPLDTDALLAAARSAESDDTAPEQKHKATENSYSFSNIVAQSAAMHEIFASIKRLAPFSTTVLITGESGTGKELFARSLHFNSPRKSGPFIAINCGAIPENLMESELFGHRKGSFTDAHRDKRGLLEEANGGTLFLDEIAELPVHLQVKLLRALQEHQFRRVGGEELLQFDARVVAATHRDLETAVKNGTFREDLFYRLNVVSIHVPPLRDRAEDIPLLARHFISTHAKRLGIAISEISPEAMSALTKYHWRGNVRELENCIERALVMSESGCVDLESLPDIVRSLPSFESTATESTTIDDSNLSIKQHARNLEIALIRRALSKTKGNRTHAAKLLEISHRALLYKMKEYGIS